MGYKQKDFADDIFHQSAYFSDGEKYENMINGYEWTHPHFESISYHKHAHIVDMIKDSQTLNYLPPVANVKVVSLSALDNRSWNSVSLSDTNRLKAVGRTFVSCMQNPRIWR
jgi:hypothetical protein